MHHFKSKNIEKSKINTYLYNQDFLCQSSLLQEGKAHCGYLKQK